MSWKVRYFMLWNDRLDYYKNPTDPAPSGQILLAKQSRVARLESDLIFSVSSSLDGRKFAIMCKDMDERKEWMRAIQKVINIMNGAPENFQFDDMNMLSLVLGTNGQDSDDDVETD